MFKCLHLCHRFTVTAVMASQLTRSFSWPTATFPGAAKKTDFIAVFFNMFLSCLFLFSEGNGTNSERYSSKCRGTCGALEPRGRPGSSLPWWGGRRPVPPVTAESQLGLRCVNGLVRTNLEGAVTVDFRNDTV